MDFSLDDVRSHCHSIWQRSSRPNVPCAEYFRLLAFTQLTCRESLRDIEACLCAHSRQTLSHGDSFAREADTLADANERRTLNSHNGPSPRHASSTPRKIWSWICRTQSTRWIPRRSICAWRCLHGNRFAAPRRKSSCTRCSTFGARTPALSIFPMASFTLSTHSTC